MSRIAIAVGTVLALGAFALYPAPPPRSDVANVEHDRATSQSSQDLGCALSFSLSSWSFATRQSEGSGVVRCESGATLEVRVAVTGAGLSGTTSRVDAGVGKFTDVHNLHDILGNYSGSSTGHVRESVQTLVKGNILLALTGTSKNVDLAAGVNVFTLTRFR